MAQGRSAARARIGYAVSYDSGGGSWNHENRQKPAFSDDMIRRQYWGGCLSVRRTDLRFPDLQSNRIVTPSPHYSPTTPPLLKSSFV